MASITPSSSADMPPESPPQEILDVEAPPQPQRTFEKKPGRLAMTWAQRVGIANTFAMLSGFGLGSTYAGRMAGFRYRAENAHRFPTTRPGWYLYHKTKNYVMMKDGIQEGVKRGLQFVGWTTLFFLIEESLDVFRGTWRAGRTLDEMEGVDELEMPRMEREIENSRDFLSTSVAGIVTAGVWSVWREWIINHRSFEYYANDEQTICLCTPLPAQ